MPAKHEDIEYGSILSFRSTKDLEAKVRQQMIDEGRDMSNMLRTLVKRGLATSKGVTWEGREA